LQQDFTADHLNGQVGFGGNCTRRHGGGHSTFSQYGNVICQLHHFIELMADKEDGFALFGHLLQAVNS
jgi:hypothetical protein